LLEEELYFFCPQRIWQYDRVGNLYWTCWLLPPESRIILADHRQAKSAKKAPRIDFAWRPAAKNHFHGILAAKETRSKAKSLKRQEEDPTAKKISSLAPAGHQAN